MIEWMVVYTQPERYKPGAMKLQEELNDIEEKGWNVMQISNTVVGKFYIIAWRRKGEGK
jgi:hypothetical protein